MSQQTTIEWTDATLNTVLGCTEISPGCAHCYAKTFAERFRGTRGHPFEFGFDLRLKPEQLARPFHWVKKRRIFVCSMSDLFQQGVPDEYIATNFRAFQNAPWHTYQLLTKRADRLAELLGGSLRKVRKWSNIWYGVSVENRRHGLPRIDLLRSARPTVAFLSIEPLLEDLGTVDLRGIHWVIVGGESGPGARPMKPEWVRSIRDQCTDAGVPFFFKQWGGVQKAKAGRLLDGREHNGMPDVRNCFIAPDYATRMSLMALVFGNDHPLSSLAWERIRRTRSRFETVP